MIKTIAKTTAKLAIVGSAVYFTVNNSVWKDTEYATTTIDKVKESLPETAELVKNLPSSDTIINTWNNGVETVFSTVANSAQCANKAIDYVTETFKKTKK